MFCPNCGKEIISGGRFCVNCGTDVQKLLGGPEEKPQILERSETDTSMNKEPEPEKSILEIPTTKPEKPEEPVAEQTTSATPAPETVASKKAVEDAIPENMDELKRLEAAVGKNQAYYIPEFQRIQAGEKPHFNWAAFFFHAYFCFYRKCGELFKKYFLGSFLLFFTGILVAGVGTVRFDSWVIMVGDAIMTFAGIWLLINMIRFGMQFNQRYYERCKALGSDLSSKAGVSIKAACLFLLVAVILASAVRIGENMVFRHNFAASLEPDISGEDTWTDPAASDSYESDLPDDNLPSYTPSESICAFDEFIGTWEDEYGYGNYLFIYYSDETNQRAYVDVATAAAEFTAELTSYDDGSVGGNVMGYGSEPSYAIDLMRTEYGLEAHIYYAEYDFTEDILFVPAGYPYDDTTQDDSDKYSDYNLYLYEGNYRDDNDSIDLTLSVVPNGSSFACELLWNYGGLLELGTVRPGVPTLLSEGTTITLDLDPSGNIHVLLEGDSLLGGSYQEDMIKYG